MANKKLIVLVMSVGPIERNGTLKWLTKIGGRANAVVVLPKQFEEHAESYTKAGVSTYVYDERKYINDEFEYFGFKPRNCGGIGRQGIAEATDALKTPDNLLLQMDDDTSCMSIKKRMVIDGEVRWKAKSIMNFKSLEELMNAYDDFYQSTGIKIQSITGATPIGPNDLFFAARKIFNNFLMYPEDDYKYAGFRYLCSDDVLYNYTKNVVGLTPMVSICASSIMFTQNQGDRKDGNAPLYNKDCSWKKSYSLRMFNPLLSTQYIARETNRILFRETMQYSKIYPPIMLTDSEGNITHKLEMK